MSFQTGHPPPHYTAYSPHSSEEYVYYVPDYEYATPTRSHRRRTSEKLSPRVGGWHAAVDSPPAGYEHHRPGVAQHKYTYVSSEPRRTPSSRKTSSKSSPSNPRKSSQPVRVLDEDDVYDKPQVIYREPLRTAKPTKHTKKQSADSYFYFGQGQIPKEQHKYHTRTHSNTTPKKTTSSQSTPQKSRCPVTPSRQATPEDAAARGIPKGYSIKNWDPEEEPIVLLGSVFDANSLGKWIYDWTVYKHGSESQFALIAGDLWLLLIKLAGKMKRAERCLRLNRLRAIEDHEMVEEFVQGGRRCMTLFKHLLKDCEHYMWRAAKTEGSRMMMGKNAGTEFVDSIFGRDRYLEDTELIMTRFRTWAMRFDANVEDVLASRRSSARFD